MRTRIYLIAGLLFLSSCTQKTNKTLFKAIAQDDAPHVRQLIDEGADINAPIGPSGKEVTPLIAAIVLQKPDIASILIQRGADVRQFSNQYSTEDIARFIYGPENQIVTEITTKKVAK